MGVCGGWIIIEAAGEGKKYLSKYNNNKKIGYH